MIIKNKTKKTTIAKEAIEAKTYVQRTFGLITHKVPIAMILKTRYGIHTLGMRYPIDVIVLDKTQKVRAIKKHLKPNRIFTWDTRFNLVIELPKNIIDESKTEIGDQISID